MDIAMIYSELRLLPALREVLQLFQNKSFQKVAKGLFAVISDLSVQQEWENKKWTEKATIMEFLYVIYALLALKAFKPYVQVQKMCQCQKKGNSSRHISAAVFPIS